MESQAQLVTRKKLYYRGNQSRSHNAMEAADAGSAYELKEMFPEPGDQQDGQRQGLLRG